MKANIKEISKITGFSNATVSNVLNGKKNTSEETMEKILKVANEIGYIPKSKSKRIKLVIYKAGYHVVEDTPFFSTLFEGISNECRENGFDIEIYNLDRSTSDFDSYLRKILTEKAEGILFLGTELDLEVSKLLTNTELPLLIVDTWLRSMDFNSISINNINAAYEAVSFLIDSGHPEIGYLKSNRAINNFVDRSVGFEYALRDKKMDRKDEFIIPLMPTMEGAYREMYEYLETKPKLATAYFADNDIIAFGAIRALKEHGFHIPEDVSIIGVDDMPYCEIMSPKLSTVKVPKQEMGKLAVRKLIEIMSSEVSVTTHTFISTSLVLRNSIKEILK